MLAPEKVAVIDIGSNSCRLVIYERAGAAFLPFFNEKVMAGLGRDLTETGKLSKDGKARALDTFKRFRAILESLGIGSSYAVATAAMREAEDGPAFKLEVETALGMTLRVLDGEEEGEASARGITAGFRKSKGLVADLGGSSLELHSTAMDAGAAPGETYLLGPLARAKDIDLHLDDRRTIIRKALKRSDLLPLNSGRLFAVGGAWRSLATVHMELSGYPLGVTHGYKLTRDALGMIIKAAQAARSDGALKNRLQRVAKRRYDAMLHAALVLDTLISRAGVSHAHVSAYGLREGILVQSADLDPDNRLLDTTELYFRLTADNVAFGRQLYQFLEPVLETLDQNEAIMRATCLMADAGARMHPDHRCDLIFEQVLRAPTPLMNHSERLFAAFAVASRYTFKFKLPEDLSALVKSSDLSDARILGTAMRLGGVYSGRSASMLTTAKLERSSGELVLAVLKEHKDMVSSTVRRRHQQLANLMSLEPRLDFVDRV